VNERNRISIGDGVGPTEPAEGMMRVKKQTWTAGNF